MQNVECDSGNKYGLALGPQILGGLTSIYMSVLPETVIKKIEDFAQKKGESAINIITDQDKIQELVDANVLTLEDNVAMGESRQAQPIALLKRTIRKFNGKRIPQLPYWEEEELTDLSEKEKMNLFLEEVMPHEDFDEIHNEINTAVFEFQSGLNITEKSRLLSQMKEREEVLNQKLLKSEI